MGPGELGLCERTENLTGNQQGNAFIAVRRGRSLTAVANRVLIKKLIFQRGVKKKKG